MAAASITARITMRRFALARIRFGLTVISWGARLAGGGATVSVRVNGKLVARHRPRFTLNVDTQPTS